MKTRILTSLVFCLAVCLPTALGATRAAAADYHVVYRTNPTDNNLIDGLNGFTVTPSAMYGMFYNGGVYDRGSIFSINRDGSNYHELHSFQGTSDGENPNTVRLIGSTIYGTTETGGSPSGGFLYGMNLDGSNYRVLRNFNQNNGPTNPQGLTTDGSKFYVASNSGLGTSFRGAVNSMNFDGSNFQTLHTFGANPDAHNALGPLELSGSRLYGVASGGSLGGRAIYGMNLDGSGYSVLHSFPSSADAVKYVTVYGSSLYGMTEDAGANGLGTVFKMNLDGTNFTTIHSFAGGVNDGSHPSTGLVVVDSVLYGGTTQGGPGIPVGNGTLFSLNLDGSNFQLEKTFPINGSDGAPTGQLYAEGNTVWGMHLGSLSGSGVIYTLSVPEPGTLTMAIAACTGLMVPVARTIRRRRAARNGRV